jgi:hypothetical protein
MSKLDELMQKYEAELKGIKKDAINGAQLQAVAKSLGPSIYLKDASLVSCTDQSEKDRVKNNFLIKKLGLADGPALDKAIDEVCAEYSSKQRMRVVFYYLLAQKFGKSL